MAYKGARCPKCGTLVARYIPSKYLKVFPPILECPECKTRFRLTLNNRK